MLRFLRRRSMATSFAMTSSWPLTLPVSITFSANGSLRALHADERRRKINFRNHTQINNHRLNGSSSPVLTATSRSYGKANNSTPHRIETPNLIEIKFGTVDYVGEATPGAKLHTNRSMGGFSANGWNIRPKFLFIFNFGRIFHPFVYDMSHN